MPKKILLRVFVPAVLAAILLLYYALLFFCVKPKDIERDVVASIENFTHGKFQYERFRLSYFPVLQSSFEGVQLEAEDPTVFSLKARRIKFSFHFFGFFTGRAKFDRLDVRNADLDILLPRQSHFEKIQISEIRLKAKMDPSNRMAKTEFSGNFAGIEKSLQGKVRVGIGDASRWTWKDSHMEGEIGLKNFALKPFESIFFKNRDLHIRQGVLESQIRFEKKTFDLWVYLNGQTRLQKFIYESTEPSHLFVSPPLDLEGHFSLGWNAKEKKLDVKTVNLQSSLGLLQVSGMVAPSRRILQNMRLKFSDLRLETIAQYYPSFQQAVPFNFGFSGPSQLEVSAEGPFDKIWIHANWNLSETLLTYSDVFAKPKEAPTQLVSDFTISGGQKLSGDFSLKVKETMLKGTLTDLQLATGDGQLNILTNKFRLAEWAGMLSPLKGYETQGEIKILANLSGNLFQNPQELKTMLNLTMERVRLAKDGKALSNFYLNLDYSPLLLEIKRAQIQNDAGELLFMNMSIYDLLTPAAHLKGNLHADPLDISKLLATAESLVGHWLPQPWKQSLSALKNGSQQMIPEGQTVNQFSTDFSIKDQKFSLEQFQMDVYDGTVKMAGASELTGNQLWHLDSEVDHLSLARFFGAHQTKSPFMNGSFFLKSSWDAAGFSQESRNQSLKGEGTFSVTNGEFNTFSILKTAAGIQGFSALLKNAPPTTPFDDLRANFQAAEGKIVTQDLKFLSRDIKANAEGEMDLKGNLNFRMDAYLTWEAAKDLLSSLIPDSAVDPDESLGPVPLLLSGPMQSPELKTDPARLPALTDNLAKQKVQKVLRNFLPEDVLFKRPKST